MRWCWCWCFHHHPTVRSRHIPSTSHRRCQVWRRCGMLQQTQQRPFGPCRGQSLWMKICWRWCCFHRRPTVRNYSFPSTSNRRCQGWRRCIERQQTPQRPFGPCRGQSLWMKVCWRWCCFHRRPTVRYCQIPNTSGHRCQEWRRCGDLQQTPQRPFGPYRGQSLWMKVR